MKLALAIILLGSTSCTRASKKDAVNTVESLFAIEMSHRFKTEDDLTAEKALAFKDAVLRSVEERKHNKNEDRALQQATEPSEPECSILEDGSEMCCSILDDGAEKCCLEIGSAVCITTWCDEHNCTCEMDINDEVCEGCLVCNEGASLGFDCSKIVPGLEDSTCEATTSTTENSANPTTPSQPNNPGAGQAASECHLTDDGNYECCDYSTGTPVCITLEVSVKPAGSSGSGASPGPPPEGNGCSSIDSTSYNICVDALKTGTYTEDWTSVALKAKSKWESVIVGNLASGDVRTPEYPPDFACNTLPPAVDDLYICFKDPAIDGVGGVLGGATPVFVRTDNGLPVSGYMQFDAADIQDLLDQQLLEEVFTHEMGHVIGFGSLLQVAGLVTNQGTEDAPDYVYKDGTKACDMWQEVTGCSGCPPIENDHGQGTAGVHWDENVMGNEMMTGFYELPGSEMPLSKITLGALEDLGYTVDYTQADDYPSAPQCGGSGRRGLRSNVRFLGEKKGHHHHNHNHHKKQVQRKNLSDIGRAMATEYGMHMLVTARAGKPQVDPEGTLYVADRFVSVVVEEGGDLFSVDFFSDV